MPTTYALVIPATGEVIDSAYWPEDLDYRKAYAYAVWEVHARFENSLNAGGPMKCVARVNLEGCPNLDDQFQWAVTEVCRELEFADTYGELDDPAAFPSDPLVDIGYEAPLITPCPRCAAGECGKGCLGECGGHD